MKSEATMPQPRDDGADLPIGGIPRSARPRASVSLRQSPGASALAQHIEMLCQLHPHVVTSNRRQDVAAMDEATLRLLLEDINAALGIRTT